MSRCFSAVARVALRKLIQLNNARDLRDLACRLAIAWKRSRAAGADFTQSRINDQWRIAFRWRKEAPAEVAIVDYH